MKSSNLSTPILALGLLGILVGASSAYGDITIPLGGGWEAQVPNLSQVSISVDSVTSEFVAIEISKDFTEPYDGIGFPGHSILFTQVAADAVTSPRIIILDESVTNLTGSDWTDYHMEIGSGGEVVFDIAASLGFSMAPFTNQLLTLTTLDADGGVVFNNSSFFPGAGPGELVMFADLSGEEAVSFTLTEFPTPEPATVALLVLGLGCLKRRRSR
ncbi:MAG TPA: PEP-CTERM sorting domain-containing protein [Phycisphaerae bacterium]|nr:PEP-CTERM sorting domain-containing protein [Phycisphaerae bacterium]